MALKILKRFSRAITPIMIILFLTGCEKSFPTVNAPQSYPGDNYNDVFEGFWNGMNNNYVFWSIDTVNWDAMHRKYQPLFANLKTFNDNDNQQAEKYFTAMTANLVDSHFNITFNLTGSQEDPALNRKIAIATQHPDSIYELPPDFFTKIIPDHYIDKASLVTGTDSIVVNAAQTGFTAVTGTINNDILYLYFSDFFFSLAGDNTLPVLNKFFSAISDLPAGTRGIIIDVRGNSGGEVNDLDYLLGSMTTQPLTYGYTRAKSGPGRLDYTPWAPAIVTPQPGAAQINVPVVVLADHFSASMAELTALAVKSLPKGKFIGTTTWGANGPLTPSVYFNGGQFTVGSGMPNGYMFVYTSSVMFKYLDGNIYEGRGIPPDVWVPETKSAYQSGHDIQLERALSFINNNR